MIWTSTKKGKRVGTNTLGIWALNIRTHGSTPICFAEVNGKEWNTMETKNPLAFTGCGFNAHP